MHVVVVAGVREPLRKLEDLALLDILNAHPAQIGRDLERPFQFVLPDFARLDRFGQFDARERVVDLELQVAPAASDPGDRVPALERGSAPENASGCVRARAERRGVEQVLLELDPEEGQLVRAVVVIGDALPAFDHVGGRVDAHIDVVVHALLPIVGPGCARAEPALVRCRVVHGLKEALDAEPRGTAGVFTRAVIDVACVRRGIAARVPRRFAAEGEQAERQREQTAGSAHQQILRCDRGGNRRPSIGSKRGRVRT